MFNKGLEELKNKQQRSNSITEMKKAYKYIKYRNRCLCTLTRAMQI